MTPAEAKTSLRAMLNEQGETMQLRRYSGTNAARTHVDTPIVARLMGFTARELQATAIVQGDRKVILHADDVAGILPLSTSDKILFDGRELAIKAIDGTRRLQGVQIGFDLTVAG